MVSFYDMSVRTKSLLVGVKKTLKDVTSKWLKSYNWES